MNKTQRILLLSIVCIITFFVNNQVLVPDIMESRNIITPARWPAAATGSSRR